MIKISPQMFKNTEYTIEVDYDIKDREEDVNYQIQFSSEMPESGRLILRLTGILGESDVFHFSHSTKSDPDNKLLYKFTSLHVGEVFKYSFRS
jgi:hypothetical protein